MLLILQSARVLANHRFAELEYHAPALGGDIGGTYREDVSQVWAFRGPRKSVQTIARHLLSPLA